MSDEATITRPRCGTPGEKCGAIPINLDGYCQRHSPDPEQVQRRSRQSSESAKRSHERRLSAAVHRWAKTMDLDTPEGRDDALTKAAQFLALEAITATQANALAYIVRSITGKTAAKPATTTKKRAELHTVKPAIPFRIAHNGETTS